jgi:hypothetical protein
MMERALVAYRNADLVGMYNLGTVKYSFVLWSNLGTHILKLNRYWRLEISFLICFLEKQEK